MKKDIHIKWAVWGGQQAGGDKYMVTDITAQVQNIVDNGGTTVQFDGKAITDPLPGYKKGWAICASIDGIEYNYAGIDYQTADLSQLPENAVGLSNLSISNLNAQIVPGGWPTEGQNHLFSTASFKITNNTGLVFPPAAAKETSPWISVDCYFSKSNEIPQSIGELVHIGDIPVHIAALPAGGEVTINVARLRFGLYNMAREYTSRPFLLPEANYYLYLQVRSNEGIQLWEGGFSTDTFTPVPK
ncbi:MAG: hypothetical protein MK080_05090 [Opitutales bacterium]|nr:hypothetical protein [Opitutales bacterium]NRA27412.1 hypothetical protein [Opitutales bacterium]